MNFLRLKRWENKRLRRGMGSAMLLAVLALCMLTLSRGTRAQPPPHGPTVGDMMKRAPSATPSVSQAPPAPVPSAQPSIAVSSPAPAVRVPDPGLAVVSPTPAEAASPIPGTVSPGTGAAWNPDDTARTTNSSMFVSKLQQMVLMLFLVGFLSFASLKMLGKYLPGVAGPARRLKQLEVIERQTLAQGATVSLVRVGKRYIVIGQTEQNLNTLCELSSDQLELPTAPATVTPAPEAQARPLVAPAASFHGDIIRHYLSIFPGFGSGSKGGA